MNQLGEDPAAKADSKDLANVWSCTIWLRKAVGAAVSSTARTGLVGRAAASWEATGPSLRMTAGSVGTLIPAREALEDFSIRVLKRSYRDITVAVFYHNPVFSSSSLELPLRHQREPTSRTISSAFCPEGELLLEMNFTAKDE